jgi:predicted acyltransferase
MAFGRWLAVSPRKAYARAWKLGLALLATFVLVRAADGFGNVRPRMGNTWIDFVNPVKYPPSIAFTTITTGTNLILLWAFSRASPLSQRLLKPLTLLGRAPLAFYVLHLFLYMGIGRLVAPHGTSIPWMIPFWLVGLAILLPVCGLYGQFKRRRRMRSAWRLL